MLKMQNNYPQVLSLMTEKLWEMKKKKKKILKYVRFDSWVKQKTRACLVRGGGGKGMGTV